MSTLITTPEISQTPVVTISYEGEQKKQILLFSREVVAVTSEKERDYAIECAGNIKAHLKEVEANREFLKKPSLEAGRLIDKVAKDHVAELEVELKRLNHLNGAFEADRQRKLQAEEQRLREEQDRLAREAQKAADEALRLQREADEREAKLAAKGKELSDVQKAKNLEAQLEADEAAEKARQEMARIEQDRAAAAQRQAEAKPTGGSLREEIDLTIFDTHALYRDCPQAVKLTADIVFLKGMARRGIKYAGVTYTPRAEFRTRAS